MAEIPSRKGYAHVGCVVCGNVQQVPLRRSEPPPWCVHSGDTYSWRDPHPDTQAEPDPWTRMVRVTVTVRDA